MFLGRRLLHFFFCFLFLLVGNVEGFDGLGFCFGWGTTTYRVMDMKRPIRRSEKPSSAKNNAVVGRKEEISISSAFSHSFSLFFFSYDMKQNNEMQIS